MKAKTVKVAELDMDQLELEGSYEEMSKLHTLLGQMLRLRSGESRMITGDDGRRVHVIVRCLGRPAKDPRWLGSPLPRTGATR